MSSNTVLRADSQLYSNYLISKMISIVKNSHLFFHNVVPSSVPPEYSETFSFKFNFHWVYFLYTAYYFKIRAAISLQLSVPAVSILTVLKLVLERHCVQIINFLSPNTTYAGRLTQLIIRKLSTLTNHLRATSIVLIQ